MIEIFARNMEHMTNGACETVLEMITIVYTVESNHSTNTADGDFPASLTWNTPRKVFIQIMEDVEAANHTSFRCAPQYSGLTYYSRFNKIFLTVSRNPNRESREAAIFLLVLPNEVKISLRCDWLQNNIQSFVLK